MELNKLGWNDYFAINFENYLQKGYLPARVISAHRSHYLVLTERGELTAEITGKMRHQAHAREDFPVVGDWVVLRPEISENHALINTILPRKSSFSRKVIGKITEKQVLVANVDVVFLVMGLDHDFNIRRLERYLTLAWDSGATPVIILNKMDLVDSTELFLDEVESVAFGVPIHAISAEANEGLEQILHYMTPGITGCLLGSSGVGKSSIINRLLGYERQRVIEVREDDSRGRHATTHRELIFLPNGGMLIDNPGMREVQLWTDEETLESSFEDIEALAEQCHFRDCRHTTEPGCAVQQAIESGVLEEGRFKSFLKLHKEVRFLSTRQDERARQEEQAKWHKIAKERRRIKKDRS